MSKPKHWWYSNVARAIKSYPYLVKTKKELQLGGTTATYSGMPRRGTTGRSTEDCAARQLAPREEADLYAVSHAIDDMSRVKEGNEIINVVELYHWKGIHNFETIGDMLHISRNTAKRRNARFVYEVAKTMGYLRRLG